MSAEQHEAKFPPSLSSVPSELDRLYAEHDGPAPVIGGVEKSLFKGPCNEFNFARTWRTYREWVTDEKKARRHWPWVALAADQYQFECREKAKYGDEPKPSEITKLVTSIAMGAKALNRDMARLQNLSYRLDDPEFSFRRGHLLWMHEYITQSLVADPQADIDNDPIASVTAHFAMQKFYRQLVCVEVAANIAATRIVPDLLTRHHGQGDRGLRNLVTLAAKIWKSLMGRNASVAEVKRSGSDNRKSNFAIFATNIAELACDHMPTIDEIATAFRRPQSRK